MECSIKRERQHFLRKLKNNPIFFLRHIPALMSIMWQRYRSRHHRKQRLYALPYTLDKLPCTDDIWQCIPVRTTPPHLIDEMNHINLSSAENDLNDKEDYLAYHRFRELLTELLVSIHPKPQHLPFTIAAWINQSPPKEDIAWETYSSCERVANLLTWISFLPLKERYALHDDIRDFLTESMHSIYQHLEYYGRYTNNHILNNARALIMCGVVLKHHQAIACGFKLFEHMLPILIQPQGSLREGSTHYQLIILNWLLDAYYFCHHSFADKYANELTNLRKTITAVRDVAASFCDSSGYLQACIGDISPDAPPAMTALRLKICYPHDWPIEASPSNNKVITKHQYDDFFMLAHNQHKVMLVAQDPFPRTHKTHAHNDLTSFVWLYAGQPILIDSGRARYQKDAISTQQKSARGHNVPLINGFAPSCESLVISGNWRPKPYSNTAIKINQQQQHTSHVSHSRAHHHGISITHNGFKRATPVRMHTRTISFIEHEHQQMHVQDVFQGEGDANILLLWQLHPSYRQIADNLFTNDQLTIEIVNAAKKVLIGGGWHSTQYGHLTQHTIIEMRWIAKLPATINVIFKVRPCVV